MPQTWRVEVTGLRQVLDALEEMDKKAYNLITKEIRDKAKEVQWAAATSVPGNPVSGWGPWTWAKNGRDLGFSPSVVASGFKSSKGNYRSKGVARGASWDVKQMDPAGAIFEVIGSESRVTDDPRYRNQALNMVRTIASRFPMPAKGTRLLTKAYYKAIPDSQAFSEKIRGQIIASARGNGLI